MSMAMVPNGPHSKSDAAHSVGNISPRTTSKIAPQSKEEKTFYN